MATANTLYISGYNLLFQILGKAQRVNDESLLYANFFAVFCRVSNVSHFIDLLNIHKITFHAEIGSDN